MIRTMLRTITEQYHLNGMKLGEFQQMKVNGMTFQLYAFYAEGLGHVSAMTATGFLGLMKMDTLIIDPTELDLPLLSYDRVHAMGNDTLIFELYDTLLEEADLSKLDAVKDAAKALPDHDLGEHWYDTIKLPQSLSKKGKRSHTASFDKTALAYLNAYLEQAQNAAPCDPQPKLLKASVYVEGLLSNGGPSTDVFKKSLGEEKTAELFRKYLFGTER